MPDKITIKPYGGLANRMRAIDSACILADFYKIRLKVNWEMSFELNCSFAKLFELPENIEVIEYYVNGLVKRAGDNLIKSLAKIGIFSPPGYDIYLYDKEIEILRNNETGLKELISKSGSVFIRTVHRFLNGGNPLKIFKPIPELLNKIDRITGSFTPNTIGIHIRRTDNAESVRYSPLEGFIAMMRIETEKYSGTKFFLATDSIEVEETLNKTFPDRIITYPKVLSRNSEEGIQDALVDMYCLSRTSKIFGSYYSSFSEVAAQISNIELHQIYRPAS